MLGIRITNSISIACRRFHLKCPKSCFQFYCYIPYTIYTDIPYSVSGGDLWQSLPSLGVCVYVCVCVVGITAMCPTTSVWVKTLLRAAFILSSSVPNGNLGGWLSSLFSSSAQLSHITARYASEFLSLFQATPAWHASLPSPGSSQFPAMSHPACHTQWQPVIVRWAVLSGCSLAQSYPSVPFPSISAPAPPFMGSLGFGRGKRGLIETEKERNRNALGCDFYFIGNKPTVKS